MNTNLITHPSEPTWDKPLSVATLIFPGITAIDYIGPATVLGFFSNIDLCWKDLSPIPSDIGLPIMPTMTFEECTGKYDILLVPGGGGIGGVLDDPEILEFLRRVAKRSDYVTSVCNGSLFLAAAGLLDGYKSATYWAVYEILESFGVTGVRQRVVEDRNRISGGGMTAGIDFGLTLLAKLRGEKAAKLAQLLIEYNPAPPFSCGSPDQSEPAILELAGDVTQGLAQSIINGAERSKKLR